MGFIMRVRCGPSTKIPAPPLRCTAGRSLSRRQDAGLLARTCDEDACGGELPGRLLPPGRQGRLPFPGGRRGYYFFQCFKGEGFYYQSEESEYFHAGESLYYKEHGLETLDAELRRLALDGDYGGEGGEVLGGGGRLGGGLTAGGQVAVKVGGGLTAGGQVAVKVGGGLTAGGQVAVKAGGGLSAGGRAPNVAGFPRRLSHQTPKE